MSTYKLNTRPGDTLTSIVPLTLGSFLFFFLPAAMFSIPSPCLPRSPFISSVSSASPLFRPHTRWTRVGIRFHAIPSLHFLRFSLSLSVFYLFYFTRTYFLRRAYGTSQRITFIGFPEIKRIPCRGLGAGKFRRRASNANHLESWRCKMCFGFSFLMTDWLLMVIHIVF